MQARVSAAALLLLLLLLLLAHLPMRAAACCGMWAGGELPANSKHCLVEQ